MPERGAVAKEGVIILAPPAALDPGGADLVGRRFSVRQVFGCTGPATPPAADAASGDGLARWSWGDRRRTLKLTLAPGDWTDSALIAGGADSWEAAEGFWLTRPWLRTEGCPGVQGDPLAGGPDQRPVCIGAVRLDRVAFEDASGKLLSEWRGG